MSSSISLELRCAAVGFRRLDRELTLAFYILGLMEIVTSMTAVVLHGTNSSPATALVLESVASFLAAVLIFIPLDATRKSCRRAAELALTYEQKSDLLTPTLTRQLLETQTLCFPHPMFQCHFLKRDSV